MTVAFVLPQPPQIIKKNQPLAKLDVEPIEIETVGIGYFAFKKHHAITHPIASPTTAKKVIQEEIETKDILDSDPADYKELDLYAILGLSSLRHKATDDDIKKAYRRKVLKHHPDKTGLKEDDASFFKCIQKAFDILSDPIKRRQYDSIDPFYSDRIPSSQKKYETAESFIKVYGPILEKESRFSKTQPMPPIGTADATKSQVDAFYTFWYNFESWRSFEWLDKEDTDKSENRDEKRWYEKQNKAERNRLKKEDTQRVSKLVEQAFKADPRIALLKKKEKEEREAKRKQKNPAVVEKEENVKEKLRLEAEKVKQEEELKSVMAAKKKEREALKGQLRLERKVIKNILNSHNYLVGPEEKAEKLYVAQTNLESLFEQMKDLKELKEFRIALEEAKDSFEGLHSVWDDYSSKLLGKNVEKTFVAIAAVAVETTKLQTGTIHASRDWSAEELAFLTKSVNKFPGGTLNRWEVIAEHMKVHGGFEKRSTKELIDASTSLKTGAAMKKLGTGEKEKDKSALWDANAQSQLEQALQEYPPTYKGEDRWDLIAAKVKGKSKKEIKERVKFLSEKVKEKKV